MVWPAGSTAPFTIAAVSPVIPTKEALTEGAPERNLAPLAPNVHVLTISDDRQIAAQLRSFDRQLGDIGNVHLHTQTEVVRTNGDEHLEGVTLRDNKQGAERDVPGAAGAAASAGSDAIRAAISSFRGSASSTRLYQVRAPAVSP